MEGIWSKKFARHYRLRYVNPLCWSPRTVKICFTAFFMIMLPIYLYIGFQPALPTEALNYPSLEIADINLSTPVAPLELQDRQLVAPAQIAGVYQPSENKLFIIGHSSTVFRNLQEIKATSTITYADEVYQITDIVVQDKFLIDMREILAPAESKTLILMTCAGELLEHQDATHRLIITATKI